MVDTYLFDEELVRMTFIVGIAVSVLLYEKTHRTTGSLVVPGFIGAHLLNPIALAATGINAAITWLLVARTLPRFVAVYGRTLFVVNIAVSVMLSMLMGPAFDFALPTSMPSSDGIGYVIPALIAYDMNRQGVTRTLGTVSLAGLLAAVPALVLVIARPDAVEPMLPVDTALFSLEPFWLALAALLSVAVSSLLQAGHRLRCGGFIGAMYMGLMAGEPKAVAFLVAIALVTYAIVQWGLKPRLILFGRRKFATVLMVGSTLSWTALEVTDRVVAGGLGIEGLPVATLFVPALLANDMERSSALEVMVGTMVASTVVLSTILVVSGIVDYSSVPGWAGPAMVVSAVVLVLPFVARAGSRAGLPDGLRHGSASHASRTSPTSALLPSSLHVWSVRLGIVTSRNR